MEKYQKENAHIGEELYNLCFPKFIFTQKPIRHTT